MRVSGVARDDAEWFRARLQLFRTFTVPSVAAQKDADFEWLLLANRTTPDWVIRELRDIVAGVHVAVTVGSPDHKDITRHFASCDIVLTTRLDSDDALHPSALADVRSTFNDDPFRYSAYVFPSGYVFDVPTSRMARLARCRPALTTKVNRVGVDDPLDVGGNHNFVVERFRTCEVDRPGGMFIRTLHDDSTWGSVFDDTRPTMSGDAVRATLASFGIDAAAAGRLASRRNGHHEPHRQTTLFSTSIVSGVAAAAPRPADAVVSVSLAGGSRGGESIDETVRAVASLLDQTFDDIAIIVFGDDPALWRRLGAFDDRRVVRVALRGDVAPPFAHAVALEATSSEYFATHLPNGWADPNCIADLLSAARLKHAGAAVTIAHGRERAPQPSFVLFRAATLREAGGCYAGIGDEDDARAHALALVHMLAPVAQSQLPLFHGPAEDPAPMAAVDKRLVALRREAAAYYIAHLDGDCTRDHVVTRFQQLAQRYRGAEETALLVQAATQLRRALVVGDASVHEIDVPGPVTA